MNTTASSGNGMPWSENARTSPNIVVSRSCPVSRNSISGSAATMIVRMNPAIASASVVDRLPRRCRRSTQLHRVQAAISPGRSTPTCWNSPQSGQACHGSPRDASGGNSASP